MIYLTGEPVYKLDNAKLVDHVVELCEKKAAEIEQTRGNATISTAPRLETAK
jgi:(E)-4-hydroxy-3-methylbut-2-enyl-diphosphate synthase